MDMNYRAKDNLGFVPDLAMIGRIYRHVNGMRDVREALDNLELEIAKQHEPRDGDAS